MNGDGLSVEPRSLTPDDMQDYIEGRLAPREQARVAAYLRQNPAESARVEALRLQAARLKKLGDQILNEPVPDQFLEILRRLPQTQQDQDPQD